MRSELHRLLLEANEKGQFEFPSEFDGEDVERRARDVFAGLRHCGYEARFEDWIYNQDATFGLAILVDSFSETSHNTVRLVHVVFSNFGNLATLTSLDLASDRFVGIALRLLKENGFVYVSQSDVDVPYDGVNSSDIFPSWYSRFFCWI